MESQLKSSYSLQGLAHAQSILTFPKDYPNRWKAMALRYVFQFHKNIRNGPSIGDLEKFAFFWFDKFLQENDMEGIRELADIMSTFSQKHQNVLMERLRALDEAKELKEETDRYQRGEIIPTKPIPKKTVYSDSQNVHATSLNQSVNKAVKRLYFLYWEEADLPQIPFSNSEDSKYLILYEQKCTKLEDIKRKLLDVYPQKFDLIDEFIQYIKVSVYSFENIDLKDIFLCLWAWMHNSINKQQYNNIETRLLEEMKEMEKMCTSGHVSRLINVLQGFTEDEELKIKISTLDQCNAVVRTYLTKCLRENEDENVQNGIIDSEFEGAYINFIKMKVGEKLIEWKNTYGKEMIYTVARVVNDFSGKQIFVN